jgi:20S proteasome alpha/beta subunit
MFTQAMLMTIIVYCRFHIDPSGTYIKYDAKAIGSGSEGAQQALQETYHKV